MDYTTYCGYVDLLMVIMFLSLMNLSWILLILLILLSSNFSLYVVSMKLFMNNFIGDLEILFNVWSLLFLCMVIMISSSVMIFSIAYMSSLMVTNFLFLYLSFVFSMCWLIMSGNFYWMMLGWDGLGVVSFLLIIFYMNHESVNNGLFTLFQNRLGDMFFVLFMIGMISMTISLNLILKWGIIMLLLGSCVKSAQFPFNSWLLAAMSAPTPISSLVHSSTLVVAGVYILLQYSYCLSSELLILKFISVLSLIISGFGLINESDMKKLIAYSTMSHVSLMMYMLSLELYKVVYFHLNIHAMFKSLMFMCFGFVMLVSYHSQDKRLVTLFQLNPMIKSIYYFSCLCLSGLPFLSAFFSKDFMIEKVMNISFEFVWVILLLLFLSISIYYGLKLMKLTSVLFSYSMVEKNYLGSWSVIAMSMVMIVFINIFLSLMLSLNLEIFSMKIFIYILVLMMGLMSVMTNLNFKMVLFDKITNMKEVWSLNVYSLDKYMYWNMMVVFDFMSMMSNYKLLLLFNWWVIVLVLFFW